MSFESEAEDAYPPPALPMTDSGMSAVGNVARYGAETARRGSLNAFVSLDLEGALERATRVDALPRRHPLRGVVLAVKDNIHVRGMPNSAGTAALAQFVPDDTSPVVETLLGAGCVVLGKAGLHELAYGITSNNHAFGAVRNPVDERKIAGGSSGGTAAAVAGGLVSAGLGTDTGGSIRLPAAMTGIVGFRPTTGLYPQQATTVISNTRDTIGLMGRTVGDVAILHSVITGRTVPPPGPAPLRLGVPHAHFLEMLDPEVERVFQHYLDALTAAGIELVHADMTGVPELNAELSFPICLFETTQVLPEYLVRYRTGISVAELLEKVASPDVKSVLEAAFGGAVSREAYEAALTVARPKLQAAFSRYFQDNRLDAVTFPTSPITARDIDGVDAGVRVAGVIHDTFATYIRNTDPASNAGVPAISIPAGRTADGLPVGAELQCPAGADERLLTIARQIEQVLNKY